MAEHIIFSFDIESDGQCFALNSMISIGIVICDANGTELEVYRNNIKPLPNHSPDPDTMKRFWSKHPEMYEQVVSNQKQPKEVIFDIAELLKKYKSYIIHWVAKPASFDWQWLKNYYELFKEEGYRNIGFKAECLSTMLDVYYRQNNMNKRERFLSLKKLRNGFKHTHDPLDDAREQAVIYFNLCKKMGIKY